MTGWLTPLDLYCERTDAGLLAEPLNAFTNLIFFAVALLLWRHYRTHALHDAPSRSLIGLIALIGVGSFIFHTYATKLTMIGDILPILCYACYYLYINCSRFLLLPSRTTYLCIGLLLVTSIGMAVLPPVYSFNGSALYLPCFTTLLLVGGALNIRSHPAAPRLFQAAAVFTVSLTFRTGDMSLCDLFPHGLHFMWHILNGVVLYIMALGVLESAERK